MTKQDAMRLSRQEQVLTSLGFTQDEADKLRRISMTLRRWHELECGIDGGCINRAEDSSGLPYWINANSGKSYRVADREKGAKKRLNVIMGQRNARAFANVHGSMQGCSDTCYREQDLSAYVQGDPRGAALYILRPGDVPQDADASSYYSRGICVY